MSTLHRWMLSGALTMAAVVAVTAPIWNGALIGKPSPEAEAVAREVMKTSAAITFGNLPIEQRRWVRLCMIHQGPQAHRDGNLRGCLKTAVMLFPRSGS